MYLLIVERAAAVLVSYLPPLASIPLAILAFATVLAGDFSNALL
jgi:uncharacterized integral membrane protein